MVSSESGVEMPAGGLKRSGRSSAGSARSPGVARGAAPTMFYPIQVPRYLQAPSFAPSPLPTPPGPHPRPAAQPLGNAESPVLVNPRPALKGIEAQLAAARDASSRPGSRAQPLPDIAPAGNDIITIHSPTKGHALEMLKAIPSEMMQQLAEEADGQPASSMFSSFDLTKPGPVKQKKNEHGWRLGHNTSTRPRGLTEQGAMRMGTEAGRRKMLHALIQACRLNHGMEFDTLLHAGVPVDSRDNLGNTSLLIASQHGHVQLARKCINGGGDINAVNDRGLTALMYATAFGRVKLSTYLLESRAEIGIMDRNGRTALHYAAAEGYANCVALLKNYGADVDKQDAANRCPLHYAAVGGDPQCVQTLAEGGAQIDSRDEEKRTPLHHCVEGDKVDCLPTLMEHGADVNAADMEDWTPLHWAARKGSLRCLQLLISLSKSAVDCIAVDTFYWTALHHAASGGYAACVGYLAEQLPGMRGAKDKFGRTPLHVAVMEGHSDCVETLCAVGVDVERRDDQGCTPLHVAAAEGQEHCMRLLVAHGAYLECLDAWNRTPLHWAAQGGNPTCVNILLHAGASFRAMDGDGFSPLHVAAVVNLPETVRALVLGRCPPNMKAGLELIKLGAREFVLDDEGQSAFDIAFASSHAPWVEACRKLQASMRIQAMFRGNRGRRNEFPERVKAIQRKRQEDAAVRMQCWARRYVLTPNRVAAAKEYQAEKKEKEQAALKMQRIFRGHQGRNKVVTLHESAARMKAVNLINRIMRGKIGKKRLKAQRHKIAAAIQIQRVARGFMGRQRVKVKRSEKTYWRAVERIHYYMRRRRGRIMITQMREEQEESATLMQAAWRGRKARTDVREKANLVNAAKKIQGLYRSAKAKGAAVQKRAEAEAAISIQRAYVRHLDWASQKRAEAERIASLTVVQAQFRQILARKRLKIRRQWNESVGVDITASLVITRYVRRHAKRLQLRAVMRRRNQAAELLQRCIRGFCARVRFKASARIALRKRRMELLAVEQMQSVARGFLVRKEIGQALIERSERREAAAALISRCMYGHVGRAEGRRRRERRDAATKIQARVRGRSSRKHKTPQIRQSEKKVVAAVETVEAEEAEEEEEADAGPTQAELDAMSPEELEALKREQAAIKIQGVSRGRASRKRVAKLQNGAKDVFEHVIRNNFTDVDAAIKAGTNVNTSNKEGNTILTLACMHNRKRIVVLALQYKANINHANAKGQTPLHLALLYKHQEVAEELVAQGANIEAVDGEGSRPIHCATQTTEMAKCTMPLLQCMLDAGADLNALDGKGCATLHYIAGNGDVEMFEGVMAKGGDLKLKDNEGKQAMHHAAEGGHVEIIKKLIDLHASPDTPDNEGFCPLHWAALGGHATLVTYLVEARADAQLADTKGRTALMNASANGHAEVVSLLLPISMVDAKDENMWTALHFAANDGHLACVDLLGDAGCDVNCQDLDQCTPMHFAAGNGHTEVCKSLINREAYPKIADKDGWIALTYAANDGHLECTDFLLGAVLQKGIALKEVVDVDGCTPLHHAAANGHVAVCQSLATKGLDVNAGDAEGMTAVMYGAKEAQADVVRTLVYLNADISLANNEGKTAQDIALKLSLMPIVEALATVPQGASAPAPAEEEPTPAPEGETEAAEEAPAAE